MAGHMSGTEYQEEPRPGAYEYLMTVYPIRSHATDPYKRTFATTSLEL